MNRCINLLCVVLVAVQKPFVTCKHAQKREQHCHSQPQHDHCSFHPLNYKVQFTNYIQQIEVLFATQMNTFGFVFIDKERASKMMTEERVRNEVVQTQKEQNQYRRNNP